jgi:hypothetical protein
MRKILLYLVMLTVVLSGNIVLCNADRTMLVDNFTRYVDDYMPDSYSFGTWEVIWTGYGTVTVERINGNPVLHMSPKSSTNYYETHSTLVTGAFASGDIKFDVDILTVEQLRINTNPNPWEVAWVIWNYHDADHFYYFIVKPNGWELGKRDPTYSGGQRFMATGDTPFPLGIEYHITIHHNGQIITVFVDDIPIVRYTDFERPYIDGQIGLYCEDSHVHYDNVKLMVK